jgi:hypothetical protein
LADRVEVTHEALPVTRGFAGEVQVAWLLRVGAVLAGGCFLLSLVVDALVPTVWKVDGAAQLVHNLRRAGVALLILTPVARLASSGVMLGLRGEWRYSIYGALVLVLLGVAIALGISH